MTTNFDHRRELGGPDVQVLLSHMALYGLGAILEGAGHDVRLGWTDGMTPRPWVVGVDETSVGREVRAHAAARAAGSWLQADVDLGGKSRGLMSPRLSVFGAEDVWNRVRGLRERVLEDLTAHHAWGDLRFVAALGEPAYWSRDRTGRILQDDGASRLEMQPRNQGSEFVGSRLRKVAVAVSERAPTAVLAGLTGQRAVDEVGSDRADSRTPTGFARPGPVDNALAWCALWGVGQFPTVPRVNQAAMSDGHLGRSRDEYFYVPFWTAPWRPAKLRSVLTSSALADVAGGGLRRHWSCSDDRDLAARGLLRAQGVEGIVRFPIARFGSDNAPERRAMRGTPLKLGELKRPRCGGGSDPTGRWGSCRHRGSTAMR